jgi:hypothetical protein
MASDMLLTVVKETASIDVPQGSGKPLRSPAGSLWPDGAQGDTLTSAKLRKPPPVSIRCWAVPLG